MAERHMDQQGLNEYGRVLLENAQLRAERDALREALGGFVIELTSNLRNRDKMLTINHAALVERIKQARAALESQRG